MNECLFTFCKCRSFNSNAKKEVNRRLTLQKVNEIVKKKKRKSYNEHLSLTKRKKKIEIYNNFSSVNFKLSNAFNENS